MAVRKLLLNIWYGVFKFTTVHLAHHQLGLWWLVSESHLSAPLPQASSPACLTLLGVPQCYTLLDLTLRSEQLSLEQLSDEQLSHGQPSAWQLSCRQLSH